MKSALTTAIAVCPMLLIGEGILATVNEPKLEPAGQPTQPALAAQPTQPARPAAQPTQPAQPAAQPIQPTQPAAQPAQPAAQSTNVGVDVLRFSAQPLLVYCKPFSEDQWSSRVDARQFIQ